MMQSRHMRAYPDANVSERIKAFRLRIWVVPIDRRCPINGYATQDKAQKDWRIEPVAAPHQQVVPADYTHARRWRRRACSDPHFMELRGMWHKHSPRYFREVMPLGGAGAKCARPSSINH